MQPDLLRRALALAVRAAEAPAPGLLALFRDPTLAVESKRDGSLVTRADREAEAEVRRVLRDDLELGALEILGEEEGVDPRPGALRWVVDPIDGTISFVRGIPAFATLVALEEKAGGRALVGALHLPASGETLRAARGLGAWRGDERLAVSSRERLADALIALPDPRQFHAAGLEPAARLLREACPLTRGYCDAWAHALVAAGAVDAMLDPALAPWDLRASQVLIEEAGGVLLTRPSKAEGKLDALLGAPRLVAEIAERIGF